MNLAPWLYGVLLVAGVGVFSPALAQGVPQGTYLQSCTGARIDGDSLVALCNRAEGPRRQSTLVSFARCIGDIINVDGVLQCDFGNGGVAPELVLAQAQYCGDLHRAVQGLAERVDHSSNPREHARLQGRLDEARFQEVDCIP